MLDQHYRDETDIDLKQTGPRLRRAAQSVGWALAAATVVATICWVVMRPDQANPYTVTTRTGPWYALGYFTGGATFVGYTVAHWLIKRRDDNRRIPSARVR